MSFTLPPLPYAIDALAPHISQETLEYHHGKHHQAYVNKLNELLASNTEYANQSLEAIIRQSEGAIFNNAAQIWNHTFYWHSMKPNGGGQPSGDLAKEIDKSFGSLEEFKKIFTNSALTQFGSGWTWLVASKEGLAVVSTANAHNPMNDELSPLLTCDVWEHAYYIDTRNDRAKHLSNFWELVNWDFASKNLEKAV